MNKMLQLSSALSAMNDTSAELDGMIAGFGLIRQSEGRNQSVERRNRRIERRRRRFH
ncbi:hypothetical protein [Kordiimonas sp.]|uniref:hypothetical protein n=1 Tax=Kordiimonas sp. TaxID=1970157 RepID=UPI003A8F2210